GHGRPLPQRQPEGCCGQPGGDGLFGWFQAIASFFRSFHKGSINENGTPRKRRPASVSQKRHALGGTHFCPHARDRNSFPLISPWGQNLAPNSALAAKRLAHSQRQISLYV